MVVNIYLQNICADHDLCEEVIVDVITWEQDGKITSLFDNIDLQKTPFYQFNNTLQQTEAAIKKHNLTSGTNIMEYPHMQPNHLFNIVIITRRDILG